MFIFTIFNFREFIIYIVLYTTVSIVYRNVDNPYFKDYFEKLCLQFRSYTDLIPISFVLGEFIRDLINALYTRYQHGVLY